MDRSIEIPHEMIMRMRIGHMGQPPSWNASARVLSSDICYDLQGTGCTVDRMVQARGMPAAKNSPSSGETLLSPQIRAEVGPIFGELRNTNGAFCYATPIVHIACYRAALCP